jgi:hypothetical protein
MWAAATIKSTKQKKINRNKPLGPKAFLIQYTELPESQLTQNTLPY